MYETDRYSVRSGNMFTLTLTTPVPEKESKEPGDYNGLENKPKINGVELIGDMTWEDFGLPDLSLLPSDVSSIPDAPLSNDDIDNILG